MDVNGTEERQGQALREQRNLLKAPWVKAERDLLELMRADRLVMNKRQVAQEAEGFDSKLAEKKKAERQRRVADWRRLLVTREYDDLHERRGPAPLRVEPLNRRLPTCGPGFSMLPGWLNIPPP